MCDVARRGCLVYFLVLEKLQFQLSFCGLYLWSLKLQRCSLRTHIRINTSPFPPRIAIKLMHIGRIEIDFMRHIWLCAPKQALLNVANNVEKIVELVKEENLFIVLFLLQIYGVPRVMCLVLYFDNHTSIMSERKRRPRRHSPNQCRSDPSLDCELARLITQEFMYCFE